MSEVVYFDLETTGINHANGHSGVEPIQIGKLLLSAQIRNIHLS